MDQGLNVVVNHLTLMTCRECKPREVCLQTIHGEQRCVKDHPQGILTTEALHQVTQTSDPQEDPQAACLPAAHQAEAPLQATQQTGDPAVSQVSPVHPDRDQAALATSLATSESHLLHKIFMTYT